MDSNDHYTGTCYGENYRGGLAGRGEKVVIGKDGKHKVERFADAAELAKFISTATGTSTTSPPRETASSRRSTAT